MNQLLKSQPIFQCLIYIKNMSYKVLSYLNNFQLKNVYKALVYMGQNNKQIFQLKNLVMSFIFSQQYVNKLDRSMYYLIYDQKIIHQFNQISISNISQNYSQIAINILQNYNILFNDLQNYAKMSQSQLKSLKQIITEPSISLPSLLRSNLAKHFNSSYQTYIYSKNHTNFIKMDQQTNYQGFKNMVKSNEQKYLNQFIKGQQSQFYNKKNIQKVLINLLSQNKFNENLKLFENQSYIEGNQIFNFFLILIKLIKNLLISYKIQIRSVQNDPYKQFYQLLLRFSTFKSVIIQLDEQLGQVFQIFREIINQATEQNCFHINRLFSIENFVNLFFLQLRQQIDTSLITYKNLIHKIKLQQKNQIYAMKSIQRPNLFEYFDQFQTSPILQYIYQEQNMETMKNILNDYLQMFVDMSINSQNILWNGHSQHNLQTPFQLFESTIVNLQKQIIQKLDFNNTEICKKTTLLNELKFLQANLNIKPRILKSIIKTLGIYIPYNFETRDQQIQCLNANLNMKSDYDSNLKIYSSQITAESENSQYDSGNQWEYISQTSQHSIHLQQMDLQI